MTETLCCVVPLCLSNLEKLLQLNSCNGRHPPQSTTGQTLFESGLRGALQKTRGLNHFQPMMVLSRKHCFFTFPLQHFLKYLIILTILHFFQSVNQ